MIPVQNIYYMLTYAFQALQEDGFQMLATEEFHNVGELCAAILSRGVSLQLKRGLGKAYIQQTEALSSPHGKINITESVKTRSLMRRQLVCDYDDFTVNSYMNRVIKSTLDLLIRSNISSGRKKELRKLLVFFDEVDSIEVHHIRWDFQYDRNNQSYRMLMGICQLVIKGLLQSNTAGGVSLMNFLDEQRMCRLYEKFILEYYRKEHPELKTSASQISWQLDDCFDSMLPVMQADIMLTKGTTVLIIDTKYYNHTTQSQYGTHTIHSQNLYQIFTYVKNQDQAYGDQPHAVSGMLLYARTEEPVQPDHSYRMSGNKITVQTLDLNQHFSVIAAQLDKIVADHFK